MTICITARGEELNSEVDPAFGRAAYFLFIDPEAVTPETLITETVRNVPGAHGAVVSKQRRLSPLRKQARSSPGVSGQTRTKGSPLPGSRSTLGQKERSRMR
jgi:hypothetical protein